MSQAVSSGPRSAAVVGRLVLAIDQGTSATKAVVIDESGRIQAKASVPLDQRFPQPGWAEQDASQIWDSVQQAVRLCLKHVPTNTIVAVGLSTQRESTLVWDRRTGQPLGPMLGWQDSRGSALCSSLREAGHEGRVQAITGLPLDAMFSASKATALLDLYDPDRSRSLAGELCLGTVDSWLLWQLAGRHIIESGNASRTLLLDLESQQWDPWLLELFNIPIDVLPTVVSSTGPFGSAGSLDPLPADIPVAGVLGDSHAALFAHAGWCPGRVKVTYGTGSSVMGVDASSSKPRGVARTIAWEIGTPTYALEGNIRSSGATLTWLARLFNVTPAEIAAQAGSSSEGVVLVPAFTGLGAPWWDDQVRATLTGLSAGTRLPHLARAGLEAIAFQIEDVIAAMESSGAEVDQILADGGPSSNALLMQLQADTSGRQVATSQVSELSAVGAAHLAGLGVGLWSMQDLEGLERENVTYQPQTTTDDRAGRQRRWHAAVSSALGTPHLIGEQ